MNTITTNTPASPPAPAASAATITAQAAIQNTSVTVVIAPPTPTLSKSSPHVVKSAGATPLTFPTNSASVTEERIVTPQEEKTVYHDAAKGAKATLYTKGAQANHLEIEWKDGNTSNGNNPRTLHINLNNGEYRYKAKDSTNTALVSTEILEKNWNWPIPFLSPKDSYALNCPAGQKGDLKAEHARDAIASHIKEAFAATPAMAKKLEERSAHIAGQAYELGNLAVQKNLPKVCSNGNLLESQR